MPERNPDLPEVPTIGDDLIKRDRAIAQRALAKHYFNEGWAIRKIAEELHLSPGTISRWFKEEGIPTSLTARKILVKEQKAAALQEKIAELSPPDGPPDMELAAPAGAEAPADQYQRFAAGLGIKLMRDAIGRIAAPKNVKELSELDQIIRRNLGLGAKGGGGKGGRLNLNFDILVNGKPKKAGSPIIDVEVETEES